MHKVLKRSIKSLLLWLMNNRSSMQTGMDLHLIALKPIIQRIVSKDQTIRQLLEDINGQLIKVADIVEQTDQDIAAQIH